MPNLSGYTTVLMNGCEKHDTGFNIQTNDKDSDKHEVMKEISSLNKWAKISFSPIYRLPSKLPTAAMITDPIIIMERRLKLVYRIALEFFFSKNPYPSRPEKLLIAKECGMSYKQISTWFQNRRDRPKDLMDPNLQNCTAIQDLGKYIRHRLTTCSDHYSHPENSIRPDDKLGMLNVPVESDSIVNDKKPSLEARSPPNTAKNTQNDIFSFPKPVWVRQRGSSCAKERKTRHPGDVDEMIIGFESCQLKTPSSSSAFTSNDQRNRISKESSHPGRGRVIKNLPRRKNQRPETPDAPSMNNEGSRNPVGRVLLPQQFIPASRSCSGSSIVSSTATDTTDTESVESHLAEQDSLRNRGQHSVLSSMKLSDSWKLSRNFCFDKVLSWREGNT